MEPIDINNYDWVEYEILGTPFALNNHAITSVTKIKVYCLSNWFVLPMESGKRTCSNFEECSIPLYECLFTRINVWFPLSDFEVDMLRFLKIFPSQLYLGV